MKGAIGDIMRQAQQVQENMAKAQEELANLVVTGESGGGMVKITMTGKHEARKVQIDPSLLGDDKDMLEDLMAAAITDAARKVESATQEKMSTVTAGMPIPPGFKFPF